MRKEAHFRKSLWFNNEWADDIVYAILREEWMKYKQL
jgi:RimJ/RimL family protein N-acetyltransferase